MPDRADLPLSDLFLRLAEHPEPRITVGEIAEIFGGRAMGGLLLIFGLACTLPLPPGGTTIFGAPLVLLAPQLAIGARAPWLPAKVRAAAIDTDALRNALPKALPWLKRVEAVSRPRLTFLFGAVGERLIGLICTVLALVLILPIPLGNILPAAAVTVLSLALVQRDGVVALLGYVLAGSSIAILGLAAGLITRGAHQVLSVFSPG
jgi:hypothetical protein